MRNALIKITRVLFIVPVIAALGAAIPVAGHGGEDHGDAKPKTVSDDKGVVLHTSRLGEFELSFKHPQLLPDTVASALLFVTQFETNEPVDKGDPAVEFESPNGAVAQGTIEQTGTAGSFRVSVPALPEGEYTVRVKLTYGGETDTATFSGVEVAPKSAAGPESGAPSWAGTAAIGLLFVAIAALFGGLAYLVARFSRAEPMREETASI